ncbi:probable tRNA-splicing endonuclease subunit sen34 [Actinia tenebrosa]|uniref:tRNA-intron lyase n=1 Tax=Actinia tenebrosa TaxID=6105 RepID=A0A6P8HZ21_ACTTE|nr:probable tRNA-splicing endonuclease subunit sen34 [Actinia tenebrosa]
MADEPFSMPNEEIALFASNNDDVFVWNAEDVYTLRTKYRIIGSLVGSLPRRPKQNVFLSLPLLLSKEETTLLLQKKFARFVKNETKPLLPSQNEVEEFKMAREESISGQVKLLLGENEEREREFADNIEAGRRKKKKRQRKGQRGKEDDNPKPSKITKREDEYQNLDDDISLLTEKMRSERNNEKMGKCFVTDINETGNMKKVIPGTSIKNDLTNDDDYDDVEMPMKEKESDSSLSEKPGTFEVDTSQIEQACMIHIPTRMPKNKTKDLVSQEWNYPGTEIEKLKYQVFLDLWEKGFYITPGSKFGGEFLAYPGDPIKFHSFYVVLVVPWTKKIGMLELISIGRLAATVKKTAVLGTVSEKGEVVYSSIKWSGIS